MGGTRTVLSPARRLARAILRGIERGLHRLRRRRVQARLGRQRPPSSVLFVCHGNICRSPFAAAAFRRRLPPALRASVEISSAGFVGPGRASPPEALSAAARAGVDLTSHRSRLLTGEDARRADWIVVMDARQARAMRDWFGRNGDAVILLGDLDPEPIEARPIPDPVAQPEEVFRHVYARIDRCVSALAGFVVARASGRPCR